MPGQTSEPGQNQLHPQLQVPRPEATQPDELEQQTRGSGGQPTGESTAIGGAPAGEGEAGATAESQAGGSLVPLSEEQQEEIRKIVLSQRITQAERVTFPLRLGARIPPNVQLIPFPREVIELVPEYRNYAYVIAENRIVVILRERREIDLLIPT